MLDRFDASTGEPLVKLGPGADYVRIWPPCKIREKMPDSPGIFGLMGVGLALIADVLRRTSKRMSLFAPSQSQQDTASDGPVAQPIAFALSPLNKCRSVKQWRNVDERQSLSNPERCYDPDAQTNTNPVLHPRLSRQQWLFPDFAGDSPKIPTESSHRLRTRRSPRKKRIPAAAAQQNTLFDA